MAKIGLTKLGLKVNDEIKTVTFNEQEIEVKQYLGVQDKLELISNVINLSADDNNFANPIKVNVYTTLEVIEKYTNINFTEKQKENPVKLYDMLVSSGLSKIIFDNIPEDEYGWLMDCVIKSVKAVYKYKNSALGLIETITTDYSGVNLEATEIQKALADPNNMAFLKDVLTKLG